MVTKKDISELRRRMKKERCTFTKLSGCYVSGEKTILKTFKETFLNLEDNEFYKYLEIAKKSLSGTIGDNLLQLDFPLEVNGAGAKQCSLLALNKSALKDDGMLESFYQMIIDSFDYTGNYLILLFHDAYDVMTKTSDNRKLDESEEVYEYTICAICPVTLSKPSLGYIESEDRIGALPRSWVVNVPDIAFTFPAFIDRSTDVNSVMYYTKNTKEPHAEIMEEVIGCPSKRTATEHKETLHSIIDSVTGYDEDKSEEVFTNIQESINNKVEEHKETYGDDDPLVLNENIIKDIVEENNFSEEISDKISKSLSSEFGDTPPSAELLLDSKAIKVMEQKKKEKELEKKVTDLQKELNQSKVAAANDDENNQSEPILEDTDTELNYDIVVKVNPDKVPEIESKVLEGKRYLTIPISEHEQANINGETKILE